MLIILKGRGDFNKTDLKNVKKVNFQPPSATFFREMYSASYGMQIYRKRCHCSLLLREETSDAYTLRNGALSLTEFLSRNECNDSRKSVLLLVFTPVYKMLMGISAPR